VRLWVMSQAPAVAVSLKSALHRTLTTASCPRLSHLCWQRQARATALWSHIWAQPAAIAPHSLAECHPVDLAQPDRAATAGSPTAQLHPSLAQLCPRVAVW